MRYAIVINLDYDTNAEQECKYVWQRLRDAMIEAGFRMEGRLFTTELDEASACSTARDVVEAMDGDPLIGGIGMYSYLKEFYGYDHTRTVNLLVPPTDNIELEEN